MIYISEEQGLDLDFQSIYPIRLEYLLLHYLSANTKKIILKDLTLVVKHQVT